jgi:hypothetical protein
MMYVYSEQPVSVYYDKKEMAFNRQMLRSAKYNIPSSVDENWGPGFGLSKLLHSKAVHSKR